MLFSKIIEAANRKSELGKVQYFHYLRIQIPLDQNEKEVENLLTKSKTIKDIEICNIQQQPHEHKSKQENMHHIRETYITIKANTQTLTGEQ